MSSWFSYHIHSFIHSFIPSPALRQVHSLLQGKFSAEYDLVLPLSISSVLSFPEGHPVVAYAFFLAFSSILPSTFTSVTQFLCNAWPIHLAYLPFTVCRIFLSLTLRKPSSFLTRSFQLILSILIQYHTSKLPRYFWSTFRSVQIQHHTQMYSKCCTILVAALNFSPTCWSKGSYSLLKVAFASTISDLISCVHLATSVTVSYIVTPLFSKVMNSRTPYSWRTLQITYSSSVDAMSYKLWIQFHITCIDRLNHSCIASTTYFKSGAPIVRVRHCER